MTSVGQIEKKTQARLVALLRDRLHYEYLGNWIDRADNRNIESGYLRPWLVTRGVPENLANRAIHELEKTAGDTSQSLYDRNAAVYRLLRYGVKLRPEIGENTVTVWLVDWTDWKANHFAFAEEVTVQGASANASTKRPDIVVYVNGIALGVLELKRSTVSVSEGNRPTVHSDRGGHYRWPGWLSRIAQAKLIRSTSRKGYSPDNAACEGFFGRLKNELFSSRDWVSTTIEEFVAALGAYIRWYNEARIKISLGSRSPIEHRKDLGIAA